MRNNSLYRKPRSSCALPLALAAVFVGCDGAGPDQAGTSSETQTALQAFADSLSTIRMPVSGQTAAARRSSTSDTSVYWDVSTFRDPMRLGYFADSYYWGPSGAADPQGGVPPYWQANVAERYQWDSVVAGPEGPRQRFAKTRVTPAVHWHEEDMIAQKDSLWLHGEGVTRWGFRWSFREMDASDFDRLGLSREAKPFRMRPRLYSFGEEWQVAVLDADYEPFDTLPLYRDGVRVGYLSLLPGHPGGMSIDNWSDYGIFDSDGRQYIPRPLGKPSGPWPYDSLGVVWGALQADGSGGWILPYRWQFLPGAARALATGGCVCSVTVTQGLPWLGDRVDSMARTIPIETFPTDKGSSYLRVPAIAPEARSLRVSSRCHPMGFPSERLMLLSEPIDTDYVAVPGRGGQP